MTPPDRREESTMAKTVSAEIYPCEGRARAAGKALQEKGLRVHHIGTTTISVEADPETWDRVFGAGNRREVAAIPEELEDLVAEVAIARPPELF
jgi:hypothetical protein